MNYEIEIEDFDFLTHSLHIKVGDTVTFRLSKQVPFHAEHIIYGTSGNKLLCFESEVLQIQEKVSYDFIPTVPGVIYVTCKIYLDMYCEIHVHSDDMMAESETESTAELSNDEMAYCQETQESIDRRLRQTQPRKASPEIVEGVAHRVINRDSQLTDKESLLKENESIDQPVAEECASDSFYDSDDEVSLNGYDNDSNLLLPDGFQSPLSSLNPAEIDLLFETSPFAENRKSTAVQSSPIKSSSDPLQQALKSQTITIIVNEFSFHPKTVTCAIEDQVRFVLNDQEINSCSIYCEGEFERITLDKHRLPSIIHQFYRLGTHVIQNEVYNFVDCRIFVHDRGSGNSPNPPSSSSPPKLSGSFPLTALPKPVFNLAAVEKKDYPIEAVQSDMYLSPEGGRGETGFSIDEDPPPYAEEEFADMLQELSLLNLEEDDILSMPDYKPPQNQYIPEEMIPEDETLTKHDGESIRNSLSSKESKVEHTDTDPDSCSLTIEGEERHDEDGDDEEEHDDNEKGREIMPTSVSVSSASGYEGLSRKAKKKKKRKEKLKMLKKIQKLSQITAAIIDSSSAEEEERQRKKTIAGKVNKTIATEVALQVLLQAISFEMMNPATGANKIPERRDGEPYSLFLNSPLKEQESSFLLATADFSENFESDESDDDHRDNQYEPSNEKDSIKETLTVPSATIQTSGSVELSIVLEQTSPVIPKKTEDMIIISPVDKNMPINESIYDEDVSFDSEEDSRSSKNSASGAIVHEIAPGNIPELSESLNESHLETKSSFLVTEQQHQINSEEKQPPKDSVTVSHSHNDQNSSNNSKGGKTNVLLSALGLSKSRSVDGSVMEAALSALVDPIEQSKEDKEDLTDQSIKEDKRREEQSMSSEKEELGPLERKLEEFTDFLLTRFITIQRKYEHQESDILPRGRVVPILYWSDLPSSEKDKEEVVVKQTKQNGSSRSRSLRSGKNSPKRQEPSIDKSKKVMPRGSNQIYVPPPARSSSKDEEMTIKKDKLSSATSTIHPTTTPSFPTPPPPPPSTSTSVTSSSKLGKQSNINSIATTTIPSKPRTPVKTSSRPSSSSASSNYKHSPPKASQHPSSDQRKKH